jgi:DNA-binding transcriptional regulator LsrR (DeoR family)
MIKYMWWYLPCEPKGTMLDARQIRGVRYLYSEGWTRYAIAKSMHISWHTVHRCVNHLERFAKC